MPHTTKWTNPHDYGKPVTLDIFQGPGRTDRHVIQPGNSIELPGEYDRAIHDVKDGVVVGGLAPMLVREGQTETVHKALIAEDAKVVAEQGAQIEKLEKELEALRRSAAESLEQAKQANRRAEAAETKNRGLESQLSELLEADEPPARPKSSAKRT